MVSNLKNFKGGKIAMTYIANKNRYENMKYNFCGNSGLKLPAIALGFWHNFGEKDCYATGREVVKKAFDLGITYFDLANNYGFPAGSAEETFGRIMEKDLKPFRDEIIIATKAGYYMWPGPYGNGGSRKYLISSLDQSLKRMNLEYVDIFYHHRYDEETPLEETVLALSQIIRSGKALYIGISNYNEKYTKKICKMLKEEKVPFIVNQVPYSMLDREVEKGLIEESFNNGLGTVIYEPLAQGILTSKYLNGIPEDSRAASISPFLNKEDITEEVLKKVSELSNIAKERGQSLPQMALAWILKDKRISSVIIGGSRVSQIEENVLCLNNTSFSREELEAIEKILG